MLVAVRLCRRLFLVWFDCVWVLGFVFGGFFKFGWETWVVFVLLNFTFSFWV